jgi:hypothetical protein
MGTALPQTMLCCREAFLLLLLLGPWFEAVSSAQQNLKSCQQH